MPTRTSLTSSTGSFTLGATLLYATDVSEYSVTVVTGGSWAGDFNPAYDLRWRSLGSASSSRSSSPSPVMYHPKVRARAVRLAGPLAGASGSAPESVHQPATV